MPRADGSHADFAERNQLSLVSITSEEGARNSDNDRRCIFDAACLRQRYRWRITSVSASDWRSSPVHEIVAQLRARQVLPVVEQRIWSGRQSSGSPGR